MTLLRRSRCCTLLLWPLLALISACGADALTLTTRDDNPPRPNPFIDPAHDPYNPLRYIASNTLTGIAFALVLVVAILQTWCIVRWGARWMMSMTIGAYCFAAGLSLRFGLHAHPQSSGIYIAEYLFVVLSPCAFIAADYVLLGRIARHLGADRHLPIPSRKITIFFVSSDISTFLVQAAGGGVAASSHKSQGELIGSRIVLAGLAGQALSFLFFSCLLIRFLYRVRKYEPATWTMDAKKPWYASWRALALVLCISCLGILVRSGYRVAENAKGFDGPLTRSQPLFYILDTLPLFIAISVYVPFWPGRFITDEVRSQESSVQEDAPKEANGQ